MLAGRSDRERLLAAAWLAGYRSARTCRAYAGDLAGWLDWLAGLDVDVLDARRVHVDLWARHLLDSGAAASSTTRRLSAVTSFYHHLVDHDLLTANPAASPHEVTTATVTTTVAPSGPADRRTGRLPAPAGTGRSPAGMPGPYGVEVRPADAPREARDGGV